MIVIADFVVHFAGLVVACILSFAAGALLGHRLG